MPKLSFPLYLFPSYPFSSEQNKVVHNEAELLAAIEEVITMSVTGEVLISMSPEPLPEGNEYGSKIVNATQKGSTT